jgi:hypothetical protein
MFALFRNPLLHLLVLIGIVWSLFRLYSLCHALLLTTTSVFFLTLYYMKEVEKGDEGVLWTFTGSLSWSIIFAFNCYLTLNHYQFYSERPKFLLIPRDPIFGPRDLVVLIVFFLMTFMVCHAYLVLKRKRVKVESWHVARRSVFIFMVIAILISESLLATSAIGEFPYRYPIIYSWIGGKRAIPTLVVAVKNGDSKLRARAASELIAIGEEETLVNLGEPAVSALADVLKDLRIPVRVRAAETLVKIGDRSVVPALEAADRDYHSEYHSKSEPYCYLCKALQELGAK